MTQAFNLSQLANKVNTSGELDLATGVTGLLPVNEGGTGQTTYTDGQLLIGNTTGNTLTKSTLTAGAGVTITNGAGSITIASSTAQIQTQIFTGPGTWTCPSTTTQVRVTVAGGGGGSANATGVPGKVAGFGGYAKAIVPVSAPVTITVGAGGNSGTNGTPGGTSSFGPAVSATGGGGSSTATAGSPGTGTVSVGTTLRTSFVFPINDTLMAGTSVIPSDPSTPTPYSVTGAIRAGAGGSEVTGIPGRGGVGGAIVVEWVS